MDGGAIDARERFLSETDRIDRIIVAIGRSRSLDPDDADDFASFVRMRLIENDYAIIRKFQGRSSIGTFLTVVITRLFLDYRNAQWGRWRPSAAAQRMGSWAVRLETSISREGRSVHEAVEAIRTSFPAAPTEAELRALAARLPVRPPVGRPAGDSPESLAAAESADDALLDDERTRARVQIAEALHSGLAALPPEDRLILQLSFWENLSVADIARTLHLEQKPLYRRIEQNLKKLRRELEAQGISTARSRNGESVIDAAGRNVTIRRNTRRLSVQPDVGAHAPVPREGQ